ncbi:MAG: glucosamine-6-phosphate isomerase, partial [Ruthenibacterium lactatiformans]
MEDRAYYHIPAETLGAEAKIPLVKMGDSDEVFRAMADMMADCIKENNAGGKRTVFICPVGPVGQYAFFVRRVNEEGISLKDVWFFNMDEYLEDDGTSA